jgi:hypothetical protein
MQSMKTARRPAQRATRGASAMPSASVPPERGQRLGEVSVNLVTSGYGAAATASFSYAGTCAGTVGGQRLSYDDPESAVDGDDAAVAEHVAAPPGALAGEVGVTARRDFLKCKRSVSEVHR